jgi:hypothetical protein
MLSVLPWQFYPSSPVLAALSWQSLSWQACPGIPDPAILSCLFYPACPILAVPLWLPVLCPVLVALSWPSFVHWLSYPSSPVPAALFWLPCPGRHVLDVKAVLVFLSCSSCFLPAVFSFPSSPGCPALEAQPFAVLSWQPCHGSPAGLVLQSCSASPVLPVQ